MKEQSMKQICRIYETMDEHSAYAQYNLNGYAFFCLGKMITELKKNSETFTMSRALAGLFANCGFDISIKNNIFIIK